jgi:hypothetical protein
VHATDTLPPYGTVAATAKEDGESSSTSDEEEDEEETEVTKRPMADWLRMAAHVAGRHSGTLPFHLPAAVHRRSVGPCAYSLRILYFIF